MKKQKEYKNPNLGFKRPEVAEDSRDITVVVVEWLYRKHKGLLPKVVNAYNELVWLGENRTARRVSQYCEWLARQEQDPVKKSVYLRIASDVTHKTRIWAALI